MIQSSSRQVEQKIGYQNHEYTGASIQSSNNAD